MKSNERLRTDFCCAFFKLFRTLRGGLAAIARKTRGAETRTRNTKFTAANEVRTGAPEGFVKLRSQAAPCAATDGKATAIPVAALAAGLIDDLATRPPYGRAPSRACYTAVTRAIAALRRRGLVVTETVGTTRGRMEWLRGDDGGEAALRPRHVNRATCPASCPTSPLLVLFLTTDRRMSVLVRLAVHHLY